MLIFLSGLCPISIYWDFWNYHCTTRLCNQWKNKRWSGEHISFACELCRSFYGLFFIIRINHPSDAFSFHKRNSKWDGLTTRIKQKSGSWGLDTWEKWENCWKSTIIFYNLFHLKTEILNALLRFQILYILSNIHSSLNFTSFLKNTKLYLRFL